MTNKTEISIVIPVKNEAGNIDQLIKEIEQSLNLVFQILDLNQDNKISLNEINELKGIIESLK